MISIILNFLLGAVSGFTQSNPQRQNDRQNYISLYVQDAWRVNRRDDPGFTWSNRNPYAAATNEPDRRIDYVLVGRATADGRGCIERAALAFAEPAGGVFPSDHFGLVVDVRAAG